MVDEAKDDIIGIHAPFVGNVDSKCGCSDVLLQTWEGCGTTLPRARQELTERTEVNRLRRGVKLVRPLGVAQAKAKRHDRSTREEAIRPTRVRAERAIGARQDWGHVGIIAGPWAVGPRPPGRPGAHVEIEDGDLVLI